MRCHYAQHGCTNDAAPDSVFCVRCQPFVVDAAQWKRLALGQQWTTEPPTEPGWYWVKQGYNPPCVAFVREVECKPMVKLFGNAYHQEVFDRSFTHWMRIEAPEPPK